ncbi:S41 family peptidase [Ekhidna sp.]|uniref:S41 family peptidase n=1 Tax=Ekhidna sp. TaxID=2608089 RepID=UPI003298ADD4
MKLIKKRLIWLMLVIGITFGCKKDDGISVALQNEVNEFVWFAMNGYYYWQADVEDLTIEKYPTYNDLYTFLNRYNQPETLFDDLLHPDDRFSWIVDDYEELEQSFQGVTKSFGYNLGLIRIASGSDDLLAYVKYVTAGGPAENAGLSRGDVFTEVNGQKLTIDNYIPLVFESENLIITLSEIQDNTISSTGQEVSLSAIQIAENPILMSETFEIDGLKVGYLVYNQFVNNEGYHEELNNLFGTFKTQGINDLILDLRYNPGGSVDTSVILASLIYGNGSSNTVFTTSRYNEELEEALARIGADLNEYFTDVIPDATTPLNRLNLSRVFILTSSSTASASELIISGLDPYLDVTLIGTTTVGKNLGSTTLYDSPNYRKTPDNSNVNHTDSKYAIQPIISRFTNVNNIDYGDGFVPDIVVDEVDYLESLPPLGDLNEPLLAEALAVITGVARIERRSNSGMESIQDIRLRKSISTILIDNKETLDLIRSQIFSGTQ